MDYVSRITQSLDELRHLEARQSRAKIRDRVRFLRLLKDQTAATQKQAGQLIGLALRQSQRLWQTYQREGLQALLEGRYQPAFGKLSAYQIGQLQTWLRLDQAAAADRPDAGKHPNLYPATMDHRLYYQGFEQTL